MLTPENLIKVKDIEKRAELDLEQDKLLIGNLVSFDSTAEVYRYEINLSKFSIDQYSNEIRTMIINPFKSLHYTNRAFFHSTESMDSKLIKDELQKGCVYPVIAQAAKDSYAPFTT